MRFLEFIPKTYVLLIIKFKRISAREMEKKNKSQIFFFNRDFFIRYHG